MCSLERYSANATSELHTIVETLHPEGYPYFSTSIRSLHRETMEAKESNVRGLVEDIVDRLFDSSEFKVRELTR